MQMPAFVHREQENGPAADAGCRRLSRIPFCGALKDLSAGNQSAGAAELRAAPRLGASQCQSARGAAERAQQLGGLSPRGPRSRPSTPASASPSAPGDVQKGWAKCLLLAGILLSRHKEAFAFQKRSEAISKEINRQDNFR